MIINICGITLNEWWDYGFALYRISSTSNGHFIQISASSRKYKIICYGKISVLNKLFENVEFFTQNEAKEYVDNLLIKYDSLKAFI